MKSIRLFLTLALVIPLSFFSSGCEDDTEVPVEDSVLVAHNLQFVANGGTRINGQLITFSNFNNATKVGYHEDTQTTEIVVGGLWNGQNVTLQISFPNNEPANFAWHQNSNDFDSEQVKFQFYLGTAPFFPKFANVQIEEYGAIDGRIKGTFNAQVEDGLNQESVNLNQGEFDLQRTF